MRFIIDGQGYEIKRDSIFNAARNVIPKQFDGRNRYYVELHGLKYPIKQLLHLVTGLPYTGFFNAQYAHHILRKLGFIVRSLEVMNGIEPVRSTTTSAATLEGTKKFAITLEQDEDGFIIASCPALPGCHSQGRTEEEAITNIREAIRGYIASMRRHGESIPSITEVREVEVVV
jgi:antitoxin HicB